MDNYLCGPYFLISIVYCIVHTLDTSHITDSCTVFILHARDSMDTLTHIRCFCSDAAIAFTHYHGCGCDWVDSVVYVSGNVC
jgi:hypothetical protein